MMTAAVFDGPGRPFRFEACEPPPLGPGELLVRVAACTLCASDLHTVAGRRTEPTPCVLGHEAVGVVEAAGDGASAAVGDRVVWAVAVGCGACFFCTRDLPHKCATVAKFGHATLKPGRGPFGGLATHCHLPANTFTVPVPDDVPDEVAAPAGCATATAVACLDAAKLEPGELLVITGAGMLGLSAAAIASTAGADVLVTDTDPARRDLVSGFGGTAATPEELRDAVAFVSAGRGADVVIEFTGSPAVTAGGFELLRVGGRFVWAGAVFPTDPVPVEPVTVIRKLLTITGVHNYRPRDLARAVRFLAEHHRRFPFAALVPAAFPLDRVNEAFHHAAAARPVRVLVRPG